MSAIAAAVAALGPGPLREPLLRQHIDPLFSRALAKPGSYLANHSLGRPLDRTAQDVSLGLSLWFADLGDAWGPWLEQQSAWRRQLAELVGAPRPDCIVAKTSAGQGLRSVLNFADRRLRVLSTRGEFDSIDVILRHYHQRGRIELRMVEPSAPPPLGQAEPGPGEWFETEQLLQALDQPTDLLVLSQVMFMTGQRLADLPAIVARAHARGAQVLLDTYHAVGVFPTHLGELGVDFAVGGSYKYLRGGPGSCWLYVSPAVADSGAVSLDTGWFAKEQPFAYLRPDPPRFAKGGDGLQESTPPVLQPYQAAAGLELLLTLGVERVRAYQLQACDQLVRALAERGVAATGGREDMGAFAVLRHPRAGELAAALAQRGIEGDARGPYLRLCPDILTRPAEIEAAAVALAQLLA